MGRLLACQRLPRDYRIETFRRGGFGNQRKRDFLQPGITFEIGIPPRRIDIITEIEGVQFQNAYPSRISANLEGISVPVISRSDLLANKRAVGRPQDLVDATWLEENED